MVGHDDGNAMEIELGAGLADVDSTSGVGSRSIMICGGR